LPHSLFTVVQNGIQWSRQVLARYPKHVAAVLASTLLGAGGATYALATLAPDPANLTVQEILEVVRLPEQGAILAQKGPELTLFRSDITRSTDTADSLLRRLGVDDPAAANFLRTDPVARLLLGRSGRNINAEMTDQNTLRKLSARWSPEDDGQFKRLVIELSPTGFISRLETAALTASTRLASGTIQSSLFAATDEARIPDAIAIQVAEMFAGDIDFHRALRKGDRFSVVYETLEGDGEPLRSGRVLSAEFVNSGKSFQAMWFRETGAATKGGYYTLDGQSLRRAYLASPMEFSRVTSGFKMRFHPILQTWRAHLGVDYAAPTGTLVRSVGDGNVEFAGVQNGFGNVVIVRHRNQHTTVYAHLSRILVHKGQNVTQGQNVGAVGATGWATGPHLHFEFRVNGQHHDPMTIARQSESVPVSATARPSFNQAAATTRVALAGAASIQRSTAD
jgi:murein DD-endopeptidase MepM/ murein hydrolase activator NlpD